MSGSDAGRARLRRWLLPAAAGLMVLVLVASVVIAVLAWRQVRSHDDLERDRRAALTVAEQFALRMDNFAAPSASAYEKGIEELMTTKGKADFDQVKSLVAQVYRAAQPTAKQQKKGREPATGKIALAGISDLSGDAATVLVAHDTPIAGSGKALHFRWTVSLRKVHGDWLVDGLPPEVAGSQ